MVLFFVIRESKGRTYIFIIYFSMFMDPIRLVHTKGAKRRISRPARESLREGLFNWIWVVIFIGAVIYLQILLFDMRAQTERLSEEQRQFNSSIREVDIQNRIFSEKFRASSENLLDRIRDAQFEYRYENFYKPKD